MAKDNNKTFVDKAWDFMASIKLAIILFALIALSSIIGTILEQGADPAKNLQVIGSLFGENMAQPLYVLFEKLGFMNMYRSWWFTMMLMLFAANIMICSLDRFPRIWKLVKDPIKPLEKEHLQSIPLRRELTLQGKPDKIQEIVRIEAKKAFKHSILTWILLFSFLTPIFILELLDFIYMKVKISNEGKESQIYAEKGRHTRLGVYITHLSILVILIGAVVGLYFGFKGFVEIPEGSTYSFAWTGTGMLTQAELEERGIIINAAQDTGGDLAATAKNLGVDEGHLVDRARRLGVLLLGFGVRLDDFDVDFYGRSDMAKEYSSVLTVVDRGREVLEKRIEVNDPLEYKGISFYQSSYGLSGGRNLRYIFRLTSSSGASDVVTVRDGEEFTIPGTSVAATAVEFNPALAFDPTGRPFTYTNFMNNPAVRLEITDASGNYFKWIMRRNPNTWRLTNGSVIELRDVFGAQQTGLQVRKDPGVWLVYLGCTFMGIGLYIAFFMNHRKLWILLSPSKGSTAVTVAMSANKNREAFERKIDKMISLLREGGK
jgi:cytochrome c biogenesis protein